ncbi:MAG: hypothetical protein AVDCRST_MAG22-3020, partial [uncultured Rubrobacteraceae bacterium]
VPSTARPGLRPRRVACRARPRHRRGHHRPHQLAAPRRRRHALGRRGWCRPKGRLRGAAGRPTPLCRAGLRLAGVQKAGRARPFLEPARPSLRERPLDGHV